MISKIAGAKIAKIGDQSEKFKSFLTTNRDLQKFVLIFENQRGLDPFFF